MSAEEDGFEDFVRSHSSSLIGGAWMVTGDRGEAEDVVQTVLIRVGARWKLVRAMANPGAYCRKAVMNEALSWRRKRRAMPLATIDEAPEPSLGPDERVAGEQNVLTLLMTLPRGQRAVIVLRYLYDLTEAQTADELGISLGTVKSQTSRALTTLRRPEPSLRGDQDVRAL